jgi:hypothetical protein
MSKGKAIKRTFDIHEMVGAEGLLGRSVFYVDGTNGADNNTGTTIDAPLATIQAAVDLTDVGDIVRILAKEMAQTDTDPSSYTENVVIDTPSISLIGISHGRTQGGLPQLKVGTTTTSPILNIRAPGCLIKNLGFNGAGATGGGIMLTDDGGTTYVAAGTAIENCHFKNCKGTTANNAATGGAIQWSAAGGAWQVRIAGCRFYKNVGDIVLLGTSGSVPQDVVIEDCVFSGPASTTDCNILTGGSGMNGIAINNCRFQAMPALGGTNDLYLKLTGSVGTLSNCTFASITSPTGSQGTFAAGGSATVFIIHCYGETTTTAETGEIFRT